MSKRHHISSKSAGSRALGKIGKEATSAAKGLGKIGKEIGKEATSAAISVGKIGKDIVLPKANRKDEDKIDDPLLSYSQDDDADEQDFRWSIRPDSKLSDTQRQHTLHHSSSEEEDSYNDDDSYIENNRDHNRSSSSLDLGTVSEDGASQDGDDFVSEDFTVNTASTNSTSRKKKKKKKKKTKRQVGSPKRGIARAKSEKPATKSNLFGDYDPKRGELKKSKSSSDRHVTKGDRPKRGGLKKSKSKSDRNFGSIDPSEEDDVEVPPRLHSLNKTKSKKLKKGRSKSPKKIDFTGQVQGGADEEESDEFDAFSDNTSNRSQNKTSDTEEQENKDEDSESFIDPITRANLVAQSLSQRSSGTKRSTGTPLAGINEKTTLHSFFINGRNPNDQGEEDGAGGSLLSPQRSVGSKSLSSRPSLANKLRVSIFSSERSNSFFEEMPSVNDGDDASPSASLGAEKERVAKLLDELESYEQELSKEHAVLELEREALGFQLDKQTNKNQELEATIEELQAKIEELESAMKSQEDDQMLVVENEILRKRLEQKEEAMLNFTSMQSLSNLQSYSGGFQGAAMTSMQSSSNLFSGDPMLSMPSMQSSDLPILGEDDALNTHLTADTDESDFGLEKPSAKLQGDLLQARGKLAEKDRMIKAQAEEIKSLRQECEDYKDDGAREKMKSYIEGLEEEKKFFMAEIAKLKEANEKAMNNITSHHSSTRFSIRPSVTSLGMGSLTEVSSLHTDDDLSTTDHSSLSNHRVSTMKATAANQHGRMQSASVWQSFFGGNVEEKPAVVQSEAEKMLNDLTRDL